MKTPRRPKKHKPVRGLGDLVERLAAPIARSIDAVAGTHIKDCQGCQTRQAALNKIFPFPDKQPPR